MGVDVLVVQHGEKERQPGDPGLTALGRAQAERTAAWLAAHHEVAELSSSPMRRALETAAPIAAQLGLELSTDERFRERMNWDGEDILSLEDFLADWTQATSDRAFVPRSGDSSDDAGARFVAGLDDLARERRDGTVVVVAHGGVTVDALRTIVGDEHLDREQPDLIGNGVPCCAITRLRHDGRHWSVGHLPSTGHLDDLVDHRPA